MLCAEYKIPFATLKFQEGDDLTWGININRFIRRNNETCYWQPLSRDDEFKVSKSGHLHGLKSISSGHDLEILPYFTDRITKARLKQFRTANENGFTGFDIKYGIKRNLNMVFTINPDFAQIEADEDQINLTRYPLYLPEKRPFFTEGASIFITAGNNETKRLFYSRRINEPVYGLKLNGKIGEWNIGVFHAMNNNDKGIENEINNGNLPSDIKKRAFYSVFRVSRDILKRSQIGLIALNKDFSGNYNRIIGIDCFLKFKNNYNLSLEGVRSFNNISENNGYSLTTLFFRRSDFFSFSNRYEERNADFNGNDIGFYNYNDLRLISGYIQFSPRYEDIGIRQMFFRFSYNFENYLHQGFFRKAELSRIIGFNVRLRSMDYWTLGSSISLGKEYDRYDHVLYPVDNYSIFLSNYENLPINFEAEYNQGKYRTGYSWNNNVALNIRATDKIKFEFSYAYSKIKLLNQTKTGYAFTIYKILRTKINYRINSNLNYRLIFQYNGNDKKLNTYFLLAYNFRPKSYLFLVYNEEMNKIPSYQNGEIEFSKFKSAFRLFQIKFSYLFLF